MIDKQTIRDFYAATGKGRFFTPDIIEFDEGRPYHTDPIDQKNAGIGRKLKKNSQDWGLEQVSSDAKYKGTTASEWEIDVSKLEEDSDE